LANLKPRFAAARSISWRVKDWRSKAGSASHGQVPRYLLSPDCKRRRTR